MCVATRQRTHSRSVGRFSHPSGATRVVASRPLHSRSRAIHSHSPSLHVCGAAMDSRADRAACGGFSKHTPRPCAHFQTAGLFVAALSPWDGRTTRPICAHLDLQNFESSSYRTAYLFDVETYSQDSCPNNQWRPQIFKKIRYSELAIRSASLLLFKKHLHHFPTTQKRNPVSDRQVFAKEIPRSRCLLSLNSRDA